MAIIILPRNCPRGLDLLPYSSPRHSHARTQATYSQSQTHYILAHFVRLVAGSRDAMGSESFNPFVNSREADLTKRNLVRRGVIQRSHAYLSDAVADVVQQTGGKLKGEASPTR